MDEEATPRTLTSRMAELAPFVMAAIGVVVLLGAAGLLAWHVFGTQGSGAESETMRFIALLILLMVALTAAAVLFASMNLGNSAEAFGLPAGSIRALLALGIMMLFLVFGMPVLSSSNESPIERVATQVPAAQLADTVRSYRDQGYLVAVADPGSPGTTTETGAVAGATNARLTIIGRLPSRSPDQVDLTKQLLTAIVTLLTTVIGFYFGSRTSTEALREVGGTQAPVAPAPAPPTPAQLRRQLADSLTLTRAQIAEGADRIRQLKERSGAAAAPSAQLQAAEARLAAIEQGRTEIERLLAAADAALTSAAAATRSEDRSRHEATASGHLRQANDLLARLRTEVGSWIETVRAIA